MADSKLKIDIRRDRILELLRQGEQCACKLIDGTGMAQSTLSYHMKILCESGIVKGREVGKWTHYRIDPEGSKHAIDLLTQITAVRESSTANFMSGGRPKSRWRCWRSRAR